MIKKGILQKLKEKRIKTTLKEYQSRKDYINNIKGIEKSQMMRYYEDNNDKKQPYVSFEGDEEIFLPDKEEYARVMSVLETWLKTSLTWNKRKYIWKAIEISDDTYVYTFKKINRNDYIIIAKEESLTYDKTNNN